MARRTYNRNKLGQFTVAIPPMTSDFDCDELDSTDNLCAVWFAVLVMLCLLPFCLFV